MIPLRLHQLRCRHYRNNGSISPLSILVPSDFYAVVENASQLSAAINTANNISSTETFHIFLKAGTLNITGVSRFDIYRNVKIYGLGSEVSILVPGSEVQSPFYVHENGGNLTLKDLTIANANSGIAYGGVIVNYGLLTLDSVVIRNNAAVWGGGAVYTYGATTIIRNSIFISNSADRAGAIWSGGGALTITCTRYETNRAVLYGGALYNVNSGASINISSSMFTGNTVSTPPAPFSQGGAIYRSPNSGAVTANSNFWPTWNGATPVATNANVPSNTNLDTVVNVTITNTRPTNPMDDRGICSELPPRTTAPTADEELDDYGVDPTGWTDLSIIRDAVRETAIALAVQSSITNRITNPARVDSPRVIFRRVMLPTGQRLEINRADMNEEYICKTDGTNIAINCDDNNNTTQFTIVHELGHLFNFRAGGQGSGSGSLFDQLDNTGSIKDYRSSESERKVVFGIVVLETREQDWTRGIWGWGSAAATPWACTGSATNPSNFQQNPCDQPGTGNNDEVEEAAADMFLNWVYRKEGDGGFLNCLWETIGSNLNVCADPGGDDGELRTGDRRFDWMNVALNAIFIQRVW